jgi:hypothetical protein
MRTETKRGVPAALVAAFALAGAAVPPAVAQKPAGGDAAPRVVKVEAVRLGAGEDELRAKLPAPACGPHPADAATVRCDGGPEALVRYAGHPVERAEFGFAGGRLVAIDLNAQTNHEPVAAAIGKRYGAPAAVPVDNNVARYRGHVVYAQRIAGGYIVLRDRAGYRYRIPDTMRRYWQKGDVLVAEAGNDFEFRLGERE